MASRNQRKKRTNKRANTAARSEHARSAPRSEERRAAGSHVPRSSTETKSALRTTELVAYAATVLAIIMAALALDADGEGGRDPFGAETAIRYITYLTIGYMVARGLAKAGSWQTHDHHGADDTLEADSPGYDDEAARTGADDEHDREEHVAPHTHVADRTVPAASDDDVLVGARPGADGAAGTAADEGSDPTPGRTAPAAS